MEEIFSAFGDPFSIWQIIGWIAIPIYLGSYQFLKPKHTMAAQIPGDILYSIHFFGIGYVLPGMIAAASPFRNLLSIFGTKKQLYLGLVVFLIYIWICAYFFAYEVFLLLLVVGSTIKNLAYFYRDDFWKYRFSLLSFQFLYFLTFVYIGSYAGTFLAVFNILSNSIGMMRYLYKNYIS